MFFWNSLAFLMIQQMLAITPDLKWNKHYLTSYGSVQNPTIKVWVILFTIQGCEKHGVIEPECNFSNVSVNLYLETVFHCTETLLRCQRIMNFKSRFSSFITVDILGWIILCCGEGTVLWKVGCLIASLASTTRWLLLLSQFSRVRLCATP